jgi:starvation-inducible outer membrane lipoprotein
MKHTLLLGALALTLSGCNTSGTTVSGSSSGGIDAKSAVQIACSLAQVVGDTAGKVTSGATQNTIETVRGVTDSACAALIKIAPVIQAAASSVQATVAAK